MGISACNHHGQICFSTECIIVYDLSPSLSWTFSKRKHFNGLKVTVGPHKIVKTSYELLVNAQTKGAKFTMGQPKYRSETSLEPSILTGVTKDIVVEDYQQGVRIVNGSNYGLDTILFTRDMAKALEIAQDLQVGRIRVNSVSHEGKLAATSIVESLFKYVSDFSNESCQRKWLWSEQWSPWY